MVVVAGSTQNVRFVPEVAWFRGSALFPCNVCNVFAVFFAGLLWAFAS
jgi:hypothetical protein